jgi:hypothetical protein
MNYKRIIFNHQKIEFDTLAKAEVFCTENDINFSEIETFEKESMTINIDELKIDIYNKIDDKTMEIISRGFIFDGCVFSLSAQAQMNWTNLKVNSALFTYPVSLATLNNDLYSLSQSNVLPFYIAGMIAVKNAKTSGQNLKKQIFDATTLNELNLVQDLRD